MKKLLGYLPFHFLLSLIIGIYSQFYFNIWILDKWWILGILFFLFVTRRTVFFSVVCCLTFFFLGNFITYQTDVRNNAMYYENYISKEDSFILQITEVLKPNRFSYRYKAKVTQVNIIQTKGEVLLSIQKDSTLQTFNVDDRLLVHSNFVEVRPPLNPHQFDYKKYLARQGIHQQVFLKKQDFLLLAAQETFLGWIAKIRFNIQKSLKKEGFSKDEFGVINALLLGQRQEVSKNLIDDYSKAGAIHILAISGLHVGIIFLLLSYFFKPLEFFKNGRFLKLLLIVFILWFFTLIAGMSPSVVRAVTMFTAVAIGQSIQRKNSVEHSLIFSMFVLLLIKPMFLFDVGFQLSYLAVFGIVTMQPRIYSLWKPSWKLIDKVWQLTTVSLAAQLSVLPLSLYYFHQFPGLFLLSNLVIVPFLGIILIGGILIILLSLLALLPDFLVVIYGGIISLMNGFIQLVSEQESFLFSGISFSFWVFISSSFIIVFGFRFFEKRSIKRVVSFCMSILVFQSILLFEKYDSQAQSELFIFHKNQHSISGIREGEKLSVFHSLDSMTMKIDNIIESYSIGEQIGTTISVPSKNYFTFQNQQFLVVDSLGVYQLEGLNKPIVILQHSPKINLSRMINSIKPRQIIADGSNYKSVIDLWKQTCEETKTPFWSTYQNGAYILK